jgi:hypothetical protein
MNWFDSLFSQSQPPAPMGADYSRMVEMYPTSSGNIFEPSGMSPSQIGSLQASGDSAMMQDYNNNRLMRSLMGMQQQQQQQQKINAMNQMNQMSAIRGVQVANNPNLLDLMTVRTPDYSQIYSLI